jgi:hypothetical protein
MNELNEITDHRIIPEDTQEASFALRTATCCSFGVNRILLCTNIVALSSSTSYALILPLAESALDLIAGAIIAYTAAHSKFTLHDLIKYPVESHVCPGPAVNWNDRLGENWRIKVDSPPLFMNR